MTKVRSVITSRFQGKNYRSVDTVDVEAYSVDSAMDTDTDSWTLQIGDPEHEFTEVLRRDNEVRVNLYGLGDGKVMNLHTGFADEITLDESSILSFTGRDITAVAVDSQRPPGNFRLVRPHVFVGKDARELGIANRLLLAKADPFQKFNVDGSETWWEVWYRLYRKRSMWIWAEPDGTLIAGKLNYNSNPTYYFGGKSGSRGTLQREGWLPVETVEIRSNKQQRVWEVFVIGSRGDVAFIAKARDNTISQWIKKRQTFLRSSTAHNAAEARVEAWEELFEGKVGAVEIKLTIADPGFIVRQNRIARVNIPEVGLKGDYFVVGAQVYGTAQQGMYQVVRLRERNYAISRRRPDDPSVEEAPSEEAQFTPGGVGASLGIRWRWHFVEAANRFHGAWPYKLFLGVLISICHQESGFANVREGSHEEYPTNPPSVFNRTAYNKFAASFANDSKYGRVSREYGVGPMQLTSRGYKERADELGGTSPDELVGARWNPRWNIMAAAEVLRAKLSAVGAEQSIGRGGDPYELIWPGVKAYNGAGSAADRYMRSVKSLYDDTYKDQVDEAVKAGQSAARENDEFVEETGNRAQIQARVLNHSRIHFQRTSQADDVRTGLIDTRVLKFMLSFADAGYPVSVGSLRSDHSTNVKGTSRRSAHSAGMAVDVGGVFNVSNSDITRRAMKWILSHRTEIGFSQLIGPIDELVFPAGRYDESTLRGHDDHIHVGWA